MATAAIDCSVVPFNPRGPQDVHRTAHAESGTESELGVGDKNGRGDKKSRNLEQSRNQSVVSHARRRGCHHCIACSGLQHHCHSTTVRSSQSAAAEWWPGGIHSPAVYFHLRARQLRHLIRVAPVTLADGNVQPQWRSQVTDTPSTLFRRRLPTALPLGSSLMVSIPTSSTNVAVGDGIAHFVGTAVLPMRSRGMGDHAHQTPEVDSKRRCTQAAGQSVVASNSNLKSNLNIQQSPFHGAPGPTVFPGVVLECSNGGTQTQPCAQPGLQRAVSMTSTLGVVTPPVGTYAGIPTYHPPSAGCLNPTQSWNQNQVLLSASSDVSTSTSSASLSAPSVSTLGSMDVVDNSFGSFIQHQHQHQHQQHQQHQQQHQHQQHQQQHQQQYMCSVPIPVLLMQPGGINGLLVSDDPAVQKYLTRQYSIKQELAFPCHQVVDLGPSSSRSENENNQSHGWTSVFRSIADTLKRSMSPN